jgi:hypothetical protein
MNQMELRSYAFKIETYFIKIKLKLFKMGSGRYQRYVEADYFVTIQCLNNCERYAIFDFKTGKDKIILILTGKHKTVGVTEIDQALLAVKQHLES